MPTRFPVLSRRSDSPWQGLTRDEVAAVFVAQLAAVRLGDLADVDTSGVEDGWTLQWAADSASWGVAPAASGGGAVDSVNGRTGIVVLDAADVGALPDDTVIPDISGLQPTSEKNQPNGYAGLDGDGTIPDNRIPSSIARDTEIGTQITAHDGSGTAHPDIRALIAGSPGALGSFSPSGKYLAPPGSIATVAPSRNQARPYVTWLPGGTIDGLGVGISSAGGSDYVVHIWMYGVDDYLRLGDLLVDAGSVAGNSPAALRMNGITPTVIAPGFYGFAVVSIGTVAPGVTFRGVTPSMSGIVPFAVGNSAIDIANSQPTINAVNSLTGTPPAAWPNKNNGSPGNQQGGPAPIVVVRYA